VDGEEGNQTASAAAGSRLSTPDWLCGSCRASFRRRNCLPDHRKVPTAPTPYRCRRCRGTSSAMTLASRAGGRRCTRPRPTTRPPARPHQTTAGRPAGVGRAPRAGGAPPHRRGATHRARPTPLPVPRRGLGGSDAPRGWGRPRWSGAGARGRPQQRQAAALGGRPPPPPPCGRRPAGDGRGAARAGRHHPTAAAAPSPTRSRRTARARAGGAARAAAPSRGAMARWPAPARRRRARAGPHRPAPGAAAATRCH